MGPKLCRSSSLPQPNTRGLWPPRNCLRTPGMQLKEQELIRGGRRQGDYTRLSTKGGNGVPLEAEQIYIHMQRAQVSREYMFKEHTCSGNICVGNTCIQRIHAGNIYAGDTDSGSTWTKNMCVGNAHEQRTCVQVIYMYRDHVCRNAQWRDCVSGSHVQ